MPETKRPLKVFLCHASQDKPVVRELYQRLKDEGWIDPWLDAARILPGQHWTSVIRQSLAEADLVIILISTNSINREGFVQREMNYAWDLSLEKPRNVIYLIPLRLEDCDVPFDLRERQWADYFGEKKDDTYQALLQSLKLRHEQKLIIEEEKRVRQEKEKQEREAAEKVAREKAEKDAAEKARVVAEEQERLKTKKEDADREATEEAEREKAEKTAQEKLERKSTAESAKAYSLPRPKLPLKGLTARIVLVFLGVISILTLVLPFWKPSSQRTEPTLTTVTNLTVDPPVNNLPSVTVGTSLTSTEAFVSQKIATPSVTPTESFTPTATFLPIEITDAKGINMHLVSAGEFKMGFSADEALAFCYTLQSKIRWFGFCYRESYLREEPIHKIYLNDYFIDVYEVSNEEYKKCVLERVCTQPSSNSANRYSNYYDNENFRNYPVVNISWDMAKTYCEWRGIRLPTEAEWEKAARGTDGRTHPWANYNSAYLLYDPAFYVNKANLSLGDFKSTMPIDSNSEGLSPYGLYNMAGNVAEWVADWYSETYYGGAPSENPLGPSSGDYKVIRGGSVNTSDIRTTARDYRRPSEYDSSTGIRCVRDVTP